MKRFFLLTFLAALLHTLCSAQSSDFNTDLDNLYKTLQKTPSFRDQIKGQKRRDYELLLKHLQREPIRPDPFDSLFRLSTLLWPIKDNHLGLYYVPAKQKKADQMNTAPAGTVINAGQIRQYPLVTLNLDSLESKLLSKSLNDAEGIYYFNDQIRLGVYQTAVKDSLVGVVLYSLLPMWSKGEVALVVKKISENNYRGIYANLTSKDLFFVKRDKFEDGKFLLGIKKGSKLAYADLHSKTAFEFKTINSNIKYLRLGNFATSNKSISKSADFYNQIKDSLNSENLIVDLRNNPGGGFKASGKFLSLLRNYSKKQKLYIIINYHTFSNAEQFVLELKGHKNLLTPG